MDRVEAQRKGGRREIFQTQHNWSVAINNLIPLQLQHNCSVYFRFQPLRRKEEEIQRREIKIVILF